MSGNVEWDDNSDMQAVPQALARAARRARDIARQTGTPLVIVRDGVLIEIDPDDPRLDEENGPATPDTVHDR